jgi:hypothetical protein
VTVSKDLDSFWIWFYKEVAPGARKMSKKKSKDKFAKLKDFIRALVVGTEPEVKGVPALRQWWRRLGNSAEGISGVNAMAFDEILDEFCPNYVSENGNSRAVVDEWIQKCVVEVLEKKSESNLENQIETSVKGLKEKLKAQSIKWEVWQFIEGLKIPHDGFEFGKASFYSLESEYIKNRPEEITAKTKIPWKFFDDWSQPKPNSLLCRICVGAVDGKASLQKADSELILTLGVLNFFAWPVSSKMAGVPPVTEANRIPISRKLDPKAVAVKIAFSEGPKLGFQSESSPAHIDFFDLPLFKRAAPDIQGVFNKANAFLKEEGKNDFRDRILTAMKWAGKGGTAASNEDSFLFFALALESLLLGGDDKGELRYRFALRLAHLLGATKSERLKIHSYAKKYLYDVRSSLVHTGRAQIPDSDLYTLKRMTYESIFKLMRDEKFGSINSDEALEKWFEEVCLNSD